MTIWDKEKHKEEEYRPDAWLLMKKDVSDAAKRFVSTIPKMKGGYKRHGAGINMYVHPEVKQEMLKLKNRWRCKSWNDFCIRLLLVMKE